MEKHMKLHKSIRALGLVILAGSISSVALAEDTGWYVGGNFGKTFARIDDKRINNSLIGAGFTASTIKNDDRDLGYKLFGGYQFNPNFALEAGYFDLGDFGYTATTVPAGTVSGRLKAKGFNVDLVGLVNLTERFALIGRAGANYAKTDVAFTDTGLVHVFDPHQSEREVHYKYGVGLQYSLSPSWDLRAEAERYRINDAVTNKGDIDMASVGLVYRFGQHQSRPVRATYVAPAKAAEPVMVTVPVVDNEQYCTILDLEFTINQSAIQVEDMEKLGVLATFMKKYPKTTAVIEGHSDNVGTPEANHKLSLARAQSVVDILVDRYGINRDRLSAAGYGASRPIASNMTQEGKRANRRVDAIIACATDIEGLTPAAARLTMALKMEFDTDKSNVRPVYKDSLAVVARYMTDHPGVSATIQGHSSNRGNTSAADSMALSERRAANVANYLVSNFGIARSRLTTEGFGAKHRYAYNTSAEGRQENQRVNIIFTYK